MLLAAASPAFSADLGPGPGASYVEPAPVNPWKFSFTPYGWFTGINGNVTARGHTVDVDESFIEIAEHADCFAALMGYFEARKGRWGFFTDAVWADLGFPGHLNYDINRSASGNPFARLPDFKGTIKGKLKSTPMLNSTTRRPSSSPAPLLRSPNGVTRRSYTALDVMGSARYWSQDVDLSPKASATFTADVASRFQARRARPQAQGEGLKGDCRRPRRRPRMGRSGVRRRACGINSRQGPSSISEGDVGGFGAGSEFSWQAVATYGFDVNVFQHDDAQRRRLSRAVGGL